MSIYLTIIIVLLSLLIVLTLVLLGFIFFLFFRRAKFDVSGLTTAGAVSRGPVQSQFFCLNHTEIHSSGICNICERPFCEKCLKEYDRLFFCFEHSQTFIDNKWEAIDTVMSDPDNAEVGAYLSKFKDNLWKSEEIPTYIVTHYKINVEKDFIESFTSLHVPEKMATELSSRLEKIKNPG